MAHETVKASVIRRAVARARQHDPMTLELCPGFFVVASTSEEGKGWMVEVNLDTGLTGCECPGNEHRGYCTHRAAVALRLGTVPSWLLEEERREGSVLATPPDLGRANLFA